jgi:hypothetical protein
MRRLASNSPATQRAGFSVDAVVLFPRPYVVSSGIHSLPWQLRTQCNSVIAIGMAKFVWLQGGIVSTWGWPLSLIVDLLSQAHATSSSFTRHFSRQRPA